MSKARGQAGSGHSRDGWSDVWGGWKKGGVEEAIRRWGRGAGDRLPGQTLPSQAPGQVIGGVGAASGVRDVGVSEEPLPPDLAGSKDWGLWALGWLELELPPACRPAGE